MIVYQVFEMIRDPTRAMSPKVPIPFSETRAHIRVDASLLIDTVEFHWSMLTS